MPPQYTETHRIGSLALDQQAERRRHPRYLARWRAALFDFTDSAIHHVGRTFNVSRNGVVVELEVNPKPQASYRLFLEVPTPGAKEFNIAEMLCVVKHSVLNKAGFHVGLEFTRFERDSEQILQQVLESGRFTRLDN